MPTSTETCEVCGDDIPDARRGCVRCIDSAHAEAVYQSEWAPDCPSGRHELDSCRCAAPATVSPWRDNPFRVTGAERPPL